MCAVSATESIDHVICVLYRSQEASITYNVCGLSHMKQLSRKMFEASVTESTDLVKIVQSQSQKAQQFSSVQDGIYARGKDLTRSTQFLRSPLLCL